MENQQKQQVVLRCFAYPANSGGRQGYYAICIDLNLLTWRPTLKEAKRSLNDAIQGYLETLIDLSREEELSPKELQKRILRPAAFWPHRAKYYAYDVLDALIKVVNRSPRRTTYKKTQDVPMMGAMA